MDNQDEVGQCTVGESVQLLFPIIGVKRLGEYIIIRCANIANLLPHTTLLAYFQTNTSIYQGSMLCSVQVRS